MNITVENVAPCRKLLRVDVDAKTVEDAYESVTSQFQRGLKLPGFRPGKVPRDLVTKNYSKDVEAEVRRKLLNDSYRKALEEQKLHVVGNPDVKDVQLERGKNFQYNATVETAPEFELPEYKGLVAKRERRNVSDADVDRALNVLRERMASYNDVDRPAKEGDIVVVNYTGTSEGKPLIEFAPTARGLTHQENFWMEIKPGHFIPGFTEQLAGASKGDKRTVNVEFPQDFVAPQLSGKQGVYEVEIVQVKEKSLPEVNEAFAKQWGTDSLEKLREGVRTDLTNELTANLRRSIRNQLLQNLSQQVQVELPESVVQGETRSVVYDIVLENQQRGVPKEQIDEKKDEIYNYASSSAKEKVKISFLLGRIAEKENITVTQQELASRVMAMAQQQQVKPEKLVKDLKKNNQFPQIHQQILLGKVVDYLEQNAKIEDVDPAPETSETPAAPQA